METISIKAEKRENLGAKASRHFRRDGLVPCVLYGGSDVVHFTTNKRAFKELVYSPTFYTASIEVDGKSYKAVLKETQFHPVTDAIMHADFLELNDSKKITVKLPLKFVGVSPGVKEGGKLMAKLRTITVKALPKDLTSHVDIDISEVELGKSIKVKDLELANMEIMNNPNIPIASVDVPRVLKAVEEEAPAAAAPGAEGAAEGAEGDAKAEDKKE